MAFARPSDDLVARVVAWHNRNPLARRISAAQVVSVGVISFPFRVPAAQAHALGLLPAAPSAGAGVSAAMPAEGEAAGSLRERAEARARAQAAQSATAEAAAAASGGAGAVQAGRVPPPAQGIAATARPPQRRRKAWNAAFGESLLEPHSPQAVARWVLRHGSEAHPGPADAPVREVIADSGGSRAAVVVPLWVHTAAIDIGAQRVRVLVAPGRGRRAVLGPRIIGRGRVGVAGSLLAGAMSAAFAGSWLGIGPLGRPLPQAAAPVLTAAASRPLAQGPAPAPLPGTVHAASAAAVASSRAPAKPEAGAALAEAPVMPPPVSPRAGADSPRAAAAPQEAPSGRAGMRHIVPFLNEATRQAAREASEAARADRARLAAARMAGGPGGSDGGGGASEGPPAGPPAQAAPSPHPRSTHATAPSTPTKPAAVPPAGHGEASTAAVAAAAPAVAWAVSTRNLRTRFESEQMLAALRDVAYRGGHGSELKLEVLPAGEDWRAVGWPFATKAEAERLRAALAARGLKAEVVQF